MKNDLLTSLFYHLIPAFYRIVVVAAKLYRKIETLWKSAAAALYKRMYNSVSIHRNGSSSRGSAVAISSAAVGNSKGRKRIE